MEEIIKPIQREMELFEELFISSLRSDVPLINRVVEYIVAHKGKRLRPILVLLTSNLRGRPTERSLKAAVIVELLHTASLIHDDVVDGSRMRRGVPSVNSIWQNKVSVLIGDFLFSRALSNMLELKDQEAMRIFSSVTDRMSKGELLQIEKSLEHEMDETTYLRLVSDKTASLISAACELGAVTSWQKNGVDRERLRRLGENIGIAFQIKDDILDYIGREKFVGKPIASDIKNNKITLPLIYSFQRAPEQRKREVKGRLTERKRIKEIVDFVEEYGGLSYAEERAKFYADKALQILQFFPESPYKKSLIELVHFTVDREK